MGGFVELINKNKEKLIVLLNQGIVSGVSFFLNILIVRLAGIDLFGKYSLILIFILGLLAVNQALVTTPMQSITSRNQKRYIQDVKGIQVMLLLVMVFLTLLGYWIFQYFGWIEVDVTLVSLIISIFATLLFDFNRKLLYLKGMYKTVAIKDFCVTLLEVALIYFFLERYKTIDALLLLIGVPIIMIEIPFFFLWIRPLLPTKKSVFIHWVFGKWLLGNALLQWFSGNYYVTVGALFLGKEVAGIIRIGQNVMGLFNVIFQSMNNYVPPLLAILYQKSGWEGVKDYLLSLTLKVGGIMIFVAIIISFFRNELWEHLYGVELLEYTYILYWFSLILIFNFLSFPLMFAIRTIGKTRYLFEAYVLSSLFGFLSANIFVNYWGITGICMGLLFTQIIMLLWYFYRLKQYLDEINNSFIVENKRMEQ